MIPYNLQPEQYMQMDLAALPNADLKELAYYLWSCFEDDEDLMTWRRMVLFPLLKDTLLDDADLESDDE